MEIRNIYSLLCNFSSPFFSYLNSLRRKKKKRRKQNSIWNEIQIFLAECTKTSQDLYVIFRHTHHQQQDKVNLKWTNKYGNQ